MNELEGNLTISRYQNSDIVSVTVEDELSHTQFLRLETDLTTFAKALFGLGNCDCTFELHTDYVGLKAEHKTVEIPLPDAVSSLTGEQRTKFLAEYETDGWMARDSDLENHHNQFVRGKKWFARVTFFRYVKPEASQ